MSKPMLQVRSLRKEFPGSKRGKSVVAVDDVAFDVEEGQFLTLLGPSGCGKTTTLRCIAGLERPQGGDIVVGDRVLWSSTRGVFVQPNDRGLGMVFQSYAIWPHMNVFDNVAFPLRVAKPKVSKREISERVEHALEVVELGHLGSRYATQLSGGQQQRLALARALVIRPTVLLLDEPLSNLDAKLRESLRFELKRLQREQGITTVYVTHDQAEALSLSNVIAVMCDGRISQLGTPAEVYQHPATRFVADFVGTTNFIDGELEQGPEGRPVVLTAAGRLAVDHSERLRPGERCSVSVRPEHLQLRAPDEAGVSTPGGISNDWRANIGTRLFMGEFMDYQLEVEGGVVLRCRAPVAKRWSTGKPVSVHIPPEHCVALPLEDTDEGVDDMPPLPSEGRLSATG